MTVNRFAGMGGHQSSRSQTDTWFTPPAIIDTLGGADSFDLDPCSHVDRPWPTARQHYTEQDNGLLKPWYGRVWCNPPYKVSLVRRFLGRMAAHDRGVALIFARTETDPFHRFVWSAASGLLFLRGRLNFHHANGRRASKNGGAPSVLIAYGAEDLDILAAAPIDGQFVPLRIPVSMVVDLPAPTWRDALEQWFAEQDGPVHLAEIYRAFTGHPKARGNRNVPEKIRQVLQQGPFDRVERGLWKRRTAA